MKPRKNPRVQTLCPDRDKRLRAAPIQKWDLDCQDQWCNVVGRDLRGAPPLVFPVQRRNSERRICEVLRGAHAN